MSDDLVKLLRRASVQNLPLNDFFAEAADRIAELEAKLAEAVEALEQLVIEYDEVDLFYDEPKSMTAAYVVARTTIAELKGEK